MWIKHVDKNQSNRSVIYAFRAVLFFSFYLSAFSLTHTLFLPMRNKNEMVMHCAFCYQFDNNQLVEWNEFDFSFRFDLKFEMISMMKRYVRYLLDQILTAIQLCSVVYSLVWIAIFWHVRIKRRKWMTITYETIDFTNIKTS